MSPRDPDAGRGDEDGFDPVQPAEQDDKEAAAGQGDDPASGGS